jgi:phytoene/squalene synthetase
MPPSYSPLFQRAGRVARATNRCSKVGKHRSRNRLYAPQRWRRGKEKKGLTGGQPVSYAIIAVERI